MAVDSHEQGFLLQVASAAFRGRPFVVSNTARSKLVNGMYRLGLIACDTCIVPTLTALRARARKGALVVNLTASGWMLVDMLVAAGRW